MGFAETFIRRPVLASMLSLGLILFGILGYSKLPVREFPDADPPIVSVSVTLPGASPQVMESAVTDVLEEELSSLEGLRTMTSASQEQTTNITLEFTLDRKIEDAAQDVRDKVSRVRGRLPEDILEPVVAKQQADAFPIMFLALTSKTYGLMELSDIADREIKPRLQTIPGVSGAPIYGERRFAMRVWLSPSELAARGLTAQDAANAIRTRSVEIPAGRIESERREFSVRYLGEMKTPAEFADITVASSPGQLIKLGDIARVEPGPEEDRSVVRYSRTPAIFVGVVRQSKANVIDVANAVHEQLPAIQAALPAGVKIEEAEEVSAGGNLARFVSVQNEYSLFHREPENGVLDECEKRRLGFLPYFPLANGLLTGKYRKGKPWPKGTRISSEQKKADQVTAEKLDVVEKLAKFAESRGHSMLELAFSWLLTHKAVASVIAGATSTEQIRANAAAGAWELTANDLADVEKLLRE